MNWVIYFVRVWILRLLIRVLIFFFPREITVMKVLNFKIEIFELMAVLMLLFRQLVPSKFQPMNIIASSVSIYFI